MLQALFQRQPLELHSPHSPEECVARLEPVVHQERFAMDWRVRIDPSRPVAGRVTPTSLKLRKRISYRNSFQTYLTAEMAPSGKGTRISGHLAMDGFVRVSMTLWFGFLLVVGGIIFVCALASYAFGVHSIKGDLWAGLAIPPGMGVFGVALVAFGQYLARDEGAFLIDFLLRTLDASDQNPPSIKL